MDTHVSEEGLLSYYLGASSDEERGLIDEHLCACSACLRAFLALKRHAERGSANGHEVRPRPEARARLYADVRSAFRPTVTARIRKALRRPVPLYQSLVAAALVVALAALLPAARGLARPGATSTPGARVDTARTSPESLTLY
jgi:anti-sigma factor RsiW